MTKATKAIAYTIVVAIVAWRLISGIVATVYGLGRTTGELYRRLGTQPPAEAPASSAQPPAAPTAVPTAAPKRRTRKAAGSAPAQPKPRAKRAPNPAATKTPSTTPEVITLYPAA
jgi:hypothetical protein